MSPRGRDWPVGVNDRPVGDTPGLGHPIRIGAVTDQPDAYLTAIANGDALVPESAARYYARPDITYRPVTGVSPSQVGVAWPPANDTNPVIQDFVRCCLASRNQHSRTSTAEPT